MMLLMFVSINLSTLFLRGHSSDADMWCL
jgi:hypothetical protein